VFGWSPAILMMMLADICGLVGRPEGVTAVSRRVDMGHARAEDHCKASIEKLMLQMAHSLAGGDHSVL
jgi:hypothetical protein